VIGCLCSGIVVYAMVIGRLPFSSPFKDEYHRQRMLRHIQKGLAPFHDREMAFLPPGRLRSAPSSADRSVHEIIYSSLFVKKNDSIEKIKKNVTKLQKNKLRNLNKYTT